MRKIFSYIMVFTLMLITQTNLVDAKNENLFQYKDKLKIENKINGTAFLAGNEVKINEKINGIGFVAGEQINVNADQDYMFLFGINVDVDSDINNDTFILGENVKLNKNIKRDAYVAGTTIVLNGNVDRNTYIYATDVEIKGTLKGNVYVNASNIKVHKNAEIEGVLKYNDNAIVEGLNESIQTKTYSLKENYSFGEYLYTFITSYLGIAVVGLVLVYLFEKVFKKSLDEIKSSKDIFRLLCKGFVFLFCVPIISLTLLMTGVFSSISIIMLIIYGLLIYVSEIFTAYVIAYYIDKKWINKKINSYVLIILGLLIIRILSIIPIINGFITFAVLLTGLGIISNMILKLKK